MMITVIIIMMIQGEEDKADRRRDEKDKIREWTGLELAKPQRAVENGGKWRKRKHLWCPNDPRG